MLPSTFEVPAGVEEREGKRREKGNMASLKKRLGATVFLAVLSLVSIILLLVGRSGVHAHLKKIGLSGSLSMDVLGWRKKGGNDNRARVIVFGDSWVDDSISEGEDGKGENWTKVLCDEVRSS